MLAFRDSQKQVDVISLTNKVTVDHHFRAHQNWLSVQVKSLFVKVFYLYLYIFSDLHR